MSAAILRLFGLQLVPVFARHLTGAAGGTLGYIDAKRHLFHGLLLC
jgi:hypothetical protein